MNNKYSNIHVYVGVYTYISLIHHTYMIITVYVCQLFFWYYRYTDYSMHTKIQILFLVPTITHFMCILTLASHHVSATFLELV